MARDLIAIDLDLEAARVRRRRHVDPVSRDGNMRVINALLDERLALSPRRSVPQHIR